MSRMWSVSAEGGHKQQDICGFGLKEDAKSRQIRFVYALTRWLACTHNTIAPT